LATIRFCRAAWRAPSTRAAASSCIPRQDMRIQIERDPDLTVA
jgi:hypothetical protein